MGDYHYDIVALFIYVLNFYLYFSRSRLFVIETRIFGFLLGLSFFSTLMDILGIIAYRNVDIWPLWLVYVVNIIYYILQNSIPAVFAVFIFSLSGRLERLSLFLRMALLLPWAASMLIILSTGLTGLAFRFDYAHVYVRGPFLPFFYIIAFYYALICLGSLYADRHHIFRDIPGAALCVMPVFLLPVFLQFFFPHLLLQNIGIVIAELFILLTIQDFSRYTDQDGKLFNRNGLVAQLEMYMYKQNAVKVFIINLDTVEFLMNIFGPEYFGILEHDVVFRLFGGMTAFRFAAKTGPGRYVLAIADEIDADNERKKLLEHFQKPWVLKGRLFSISAHLCEISIPDDTRDIQRIFQAQYQMSRMPGTYSPNTILGLDDLFLADSGRQHDIIEALRRAVQKSSFIVYYQPIVSESTGKIITAEALLRMNDPVLGWVPPAEFIPVSEYIGVIHRIGDEVIDQACSFLSRLRSSGLDLDYIEINLSALQCIQANLTGHLCAMIHNYGLVPEDLCFEITETAANFSPALMKKNLDEMAAAGFLIAIDDFGTGYSNMGSLMATPFTSVKLDRSLSLGMGSSEDVKEGMEGIVSMFRHFDACLIAEGIETDAQRRMASAMGIDFMQGFLFAKPMPPDTFMNYMRNRTSTCI